MSDSAQSAVVPGNRSAQLWRRLRVFMRPVQTSHARDFVAWVMVGEGLIRFIDGALFTTPQLDYLPARLWGLVQVLLGALLLATRDQCRRVSLAGRVVASIGCGFLVAMAYTLFDVSAPSAFLHGSLAFILVLEAQISECQ